jgi:hypothetical protein
MSEFSFGGWWVLGNCVQANGLKYAEMMTRGDRCGCRLDVAKATKCVAFRSKETPDGASLHWPEGKDKPQNNYWVKEGVFFRPRPDIPPSHTEWQKASFGAPESNVDESEKSAVLELIQK